MHFLAALFALIAGMGFEMPIHEPRGFFLGNGHAARDAPDHVNLRAQFQQGGEGLGGGKNDQMFRIFLFYRPVNGNARNYIAQSACSFKDEDALPMPQTQERHIKKKPQFMNRLHELGVRAAALFQ
jgi:hypothetical protein